MTHRFEKILLSSVLTFALNSSVALANPVVATTPQSENTTLILVVLAGFAVLWVYLLPSEIAFSRDHPNRYLILILNIFGGPTILGWFIGLAWACNGLHKGKSGGGESGLNFFAGDEKKVRLIGGGDSHLALKDLHDSGILTDEQYKSASLRRLEESGLIEGPKRIAQRSDARKGLAIIGGYIVVLCALASAATYNHKPTQISTPTSIEVSPESEQWRPFQSTH